MEYFIATYIEGSVNGKFSVAEGSERNVMKLETLTLIENGKTSYKIIYPDGTHYLKTVAVEMATSLKTYTGVTIFAGSDSVAPGKDTSKLSEIVIGNCSRADCAELLKQLDYNEYGVFVRGNKIFAVGWTDTTAGLAAGMIESEIKKGYSSATKSFEIEQSYEVIRSNNTWKIDIPAFDKGELTTCADVGEDNLLFYYSKTQKADYDAYLSALKSASYEKVYENQMVNNLFACYRNKAKDTVVYVTYTPVEE